MAKLNHKQKVKLARIMVHGKIRQNVSFISKEKGIENHSMKIPLFNNPAWNFKRAATALRVAKRHGRTHARAVARRKEIVLA